MIRRIKRKAAYVLAAFYVTMAQGITVNATTIDKSIFVTGTRKLIVDAITALQILISAACVLYWLFVTAMKHFFSEGGEEQQWKKKQWGTVIVAVVANLVLTVFNMIGRYYNVSIKL